MQLSVRSMPIGFVFTLKTDAGIEYEGVSMSIASIFARVEQLNAKVIEPDFKRVKESA